MSKLRSYLLVFLAILVLSIFLPKMYKNVFSSKINKQRVVYSPVEKNFIKISSFAKKNKKNVYSSFDEKTVYTLDEYKARLPFIYYYDLLKTNNFPKEFISYSDDLNAIKIEKSYLKVKPSVINTKVVNLYPLFESNPKYSGLSLPKDLFRLDEKGITFIQTDTNTIDVKKSEFYSNLFLENGAYFPLKEAFGTPSTQKPFDEGYFINDARNQLFHLKMTDNIPSLKKVNLEGMDFRYAIIKEDKRKEYYGIIIDEESNLYLLMYDDYELVKLPISSYNYKTSTFKIQTTPINRIITIVDIKKLQNKKITKTYITNLDYEIVKENTFEFVFKGSNIYERVKQALFPFEISISLNNNAFYSFEIKNVNYLAFFLSILLSFCLLIYVKLSNKEIKNHILQACLIVLTGIYALIVLLVFNILVINKKLEKKEKSENI